MGLMRAAIDESVGDELPAEPGHSATVDVDFLTTRVTMDVILRTLFSHAATRAEASSVSTAIRALTRQSMREVFWAFVPPNWLPYPGRASKLKHLQTINALVRAHIKTRAGEAKGTNTEPDVLNMLLAACDDNPTTGSATLTSQEIHDRTGSGTGSGHPPLEVDRFCHRF